MRTGSIRTAKITVGAVLLVFLLGIVGGLVALTLLKFTDDDAVEAPLVSVIIDTPSGRLFESILGAETPLAAIERAGLAAGFAVARNPDGLTLQAAAGFVDGEGGSWAFTVTRGGQTTPEPGIEGTYRLQESDGVRWLFG